MQLSESVEQFPVIKLRDEYKRVMVVYHQTQWIMCYAPPPRLLKKIEPVLRSLASPDSGAVAAAINAITAFSGRFSGLCFEALLVFPPILFFHCRLTHRHYIVGYLHISQVQHCTVQRGIYESIMHDYIYSSL